MSGTMHERNKSHVCFRFLRQCQRPLHRERIVLNVVVFFFAFTTIILAKFGQCLKLSRNSAEEIISNNGGILFWEHFKIQITTKWPLAPCFFSSHWYWWKFFLSTHRYFRSDWKVYCNSYHYFLCPEKCQTTDNLVVMRHSLPTGDTSTSSHVWRGTFYNQCRGYSSWMNTWIKGRVGFMLI